MFWKLDVLSEGESIARHERITFNSRTFYLAPDISSEFEPKTVPGYTALDTEGTPIEIIGGPECSLEGTEEGRLSIKGMGIYFSSGGPGGGGLYYGVLGEGGSFEEVTALDDPRLPRQWNLTPILEGPGYAGSE